MNLLFNLVNGYSQQNKEIYLFEFCVLEDDFSAINSLMDMLDEKVRKKIIVV